MNITKIKNRAEELLQVSKPQVIRICTIMMLIELIPSLFSGSDNAFISMIYFIASIVFLAFHHGYVVTSLKVARNNSEALSDDDSFVGFTRFKDLFPTYFISGLIMFAVVFVVIFILIFVFAGLFGALASSMSGVVLNAILDQGNPYALIYYLVQIAPSFIFVFLLIVIIIVVVIYMVNAFTFAMPYLLEQYNMRTGTALKESISFIKGHVLDYIKLELSFIGWMIVVLIIQSILVEFLAFIPVIGSLIAIAISSLVGIYLYYPKYIVSKAIFFEEIAYYRYDQGYQQRDVNHE